MVKSATLPIEAEPVREVALTPRRDADETLAMIERLAANPQFDADKLDKLLEMRERVMAREAEIVFNAAMSDAQKDMRPIAADAENPQTRSRYASYEALDRALRPIYTSHGFALSFNTADSPLADHVRVVCDVTHGGHSKPYRLDMPADGKGAKGGDVMTKTHATGSALTYGMRYLLKMIFNVAVGEFDDDGNAAAKHSDAPVITPEGYDDWIVQVETLSTTQPREMYALFNKSNPKLRQHLNKYEKARWDRCKANAEAAS